MRNVNIFSAFSTLCPSVVTFAAKAGDPVLYLIYVLHYNIKLSAFSAYNMQFSA